MLPLFTRMCGPPPRIGVTPMICAQIPQRDIKAPYLRLVATAKNGMDRTVVGFTSIFQMANTSLSGSQLTQTVVRNSTRVPNGHIICSEKWRNSDIISILQGSLSVLYEDHLGIVDFHPSSDMAVVYLTEADIVAGTMYKRKLVKLRMASSMRGVVIAERTTTSAQYFQNLQKFAVLELGLVLIPVTTQREAGNLLVQLVGVENRPHTNHFRQKRKPPPIDGAVLATLQLVPKLGEVKARALLEKFHSIDKIASASTEDLSSVVGKSIATQVQAFFTQKPS